MPRFLGENESAMVVFRSVLICLFFSVAAYSQQAPQVTVSPLQVVETDPVEVRGTGFTPNARVVSHLRRPDGSEYEVLWFLTNSAGEFSHTIDTLLLDSGTFDLWIVDDASKRTSNTARFAVDFQVAVPSPPEVQQVVSKYIGVWRGNGARKDPSTIVIAITGGNSGPVAGTIAFPALSCGGILSFRAVRLDSIDFFQTSSYGVERCGDGGAIQVKLAADGTLSLSGAATGTLTRLKD